MLPIDLKGKVAFVAGVGDDQGFGWSIAKALAEAGATILVGSWTPIANIFRMALRQGKFDDSRRLSSGELMEFASIYALDALYDSPADIPEEVRTHRRYREHSGYSISEVAETIAQEHGSLDILIHTMANGPEVQKPLLETSRHGYLAALSSSAYSFVSLIQHFGPHFAEGGSALTLSYIAADRTIPGYGGGMSSAKAALQSDTRTLAFEAGRTFGIRVNAISAGPLPSRAARAIGMIEEMCDYSRNNAPLSREFHAEDVANVAAFLSSPLAQAVTGTTCFVDNGLHAMGIPIPPSSPFCGCKKERVADHGRCCSAPSSEEKKENLCCSSKSRE